MPTTLPAATDYTGPAVTEGGKKTFMTSVRAFIADLFGADSTMLAAHTAFKNYGGETLLNGSLAASVGSSALTIALKTAAGADPSAADPVLVAFRNATIGTGTVTLLAVTAPLSIVIPSTATMGQTNAVAARLWVALINNAGTVELAAKNTQIGNGKIDPINEGSLISTVALGTGSDSAGVWYSTTLRSNVAFRLAGYIESTQATAGTWATTPSVIQTMAPGVSKPGEVIQDVYNFTGTSATGTTVIPSDNTIPQITEGNEYMTQAVTPTSAINTLCIEAVGQFSSNLSNPSFFTAALFQNSTANALQASIKRINSVNEIHQQRLFYAMPAGATTAQTFRIRAGGDSAGTTTFNGGGGSGILGGVMNSFMRVTEVMA